MGGAMAWVALVSALVVAAASAEVLVDLPVGGQVALSTRGPSAFRVRFFKDPLETPMVAPEESDARFLTAPQELGTGIIAAFGSITLSAKSTLVLRDIGGHVITESGPLIPKHNQLLLSTRSGKFYGRGASPADATKLISSSSSPIVCNKATYAPHYWSTDGYAALGVVSSTDGQKYPVKYNSDGATLAWYFEGPFELYLMPAATLAEGTQAYYALTGAPVVPPRYAFGFTASRWGWESRTYVLDIVKDFRDKQFPIDAIIIDFEWFTNQSDYDFKEDGKPWYNDFGFNPVVFGPSTPWQPKSFLSTLQDEMHVKFGGIRKPRLGNTALLETARKSNWLLPGCEPGGTYPPDDSHKSDYACHRNLDFSQTAVRQWYASQTEGLLDAGVDFWWNDEGETDYFTNYWWNVAQVAALRAKSSDRRFYSLNRAWTPGMARLGAAVWTGDISATWQELATTPGMMLNWVLGGAPYVACDIGGFLGQDKPDLLTRWMQVGTYMPIMRVHSVLGVTPHWPWLFGEQAAAAIRKTLEARYRLVPYHYSLAYKMYSEKKPWIRPLAMEFPDDGYVSDVTTEWMDGDILVAPILREDAVREVYLPRGTWYVFNAASQKVQRGLLIEGPTHLGGTADFDEVPTFVQAGSIIPLAPVVQHTGELPGGALHVHVYGGADATFEFVEDDGETVAYTTGQVLITRFTWDETKGTLTWRQHGSAAAAGKSAFKEMHVTLIDSSGIYHSEMLDIRSGWVLLRPKVDVSDINI